MDGKVREAIFTAVEKEPFALNMGMQLVELEEGYSAVEMPYEPERMDNIYGRAHGGSIFALIDEAFEAVSQSDGTIAVALNVNVTYAASPEPGALLRAEARAVNITKKTASYDIRVMEKSGKLIATCNALAFRTGKPIPFMDGSA
jgi:acyl-CoA thioesterase